MAGKGFAVRATPAAVAAIDGLRGRARKSYEAFEGELRKQGCKVAGYRLLAAEGGEYSEYCCKRLVDDWRVIVTFEPASPSLSQSAATMIARLDADLSMTIEVGPIGQRREEKPDCCGEDGWPSMG